MKAGTTAEIIQLPGGARLSGISILQLVQKRVSEKSEYLLSGLQANVANALFEEMRDFKQEDALRHHFNVMRAMRNGEPAYHSAFCELMNRTWATFATGLDESHIEPPMGEVTVWIEAMSSRTENHYKVLLQEVRARFNTLLQDRQVRHPLLPEIYYRAFWQSLHQMDLGYIERRSLLPLFHRFFMDRYGQIVGLANRTMIRLEVDTSP